MRIDVQDLAESLRFYCEILQFKVIVRYDTPTHTIVQVSPTGKSPGLELWWEPNRVVRPDPLLHVAFGVDDLIAVIERLRGLGVQVARDPFTIGDEFLAFVRDPNGLLIELTEIGERMAAAIGPS